MKIEFVKRDGVVDLVYDKEAQKLSDEDKAIFLYEIMNMVQSELHNVENLID